MSPEAKSIRCAWIREVIRQEASNPIPDKVWLARLRSMLKDLGG